MKRMPELCLCGAPDCPRCFPGNGYRDARGRWRAYKEDDRTPLDQEYDGDRSEDYEGEG